ncbi:MAG: permease [Erythrobacter sp. RIFCSPHIGHO2_12_FULL_63_10]|nr:MAG: permease [Erythrobacter sp. RIFCSPHIGHO2_12_FULL_63_10]
MFLPVLAAIIGIGFFSGMDAVMKSASIAIGAYSAFFLRCVIGFAMILPYWLVRERNWPQRAVLKVHLVRGVVVAFMGWSFFFSLIYLPLAEAIALSFISPLIALYLAAVLLGEQISRRAIIAAVLGLVGVTIIVGGKLGQEDLSDDAVIGLVALLVSAVLYAWNLVLQRQQALLASPSEISTFLNGSIALTMMAGAPFLLVMPEAGVWLELTASAAMAVAAALFLSWGYARAEAQVLVPIEYTALLWAIALGWWVFGEQVTIATLAGALLIVVGCLIATTRRPEPSAI